MNELIVVAGLCLKLNALSRKTRVLLSWEERQGSEEELGLVCVGLKG